MYELILLTGALAPVAVLLGIIYYFDRQQPEPLRQIVKAIIYGVISAGIAIILADILAPLRFNANTAVSAALYDAFFGAAIPEEAAKMLMLWLFIRKNPYFDEYVDGIVYACCIALGFAGLENIMYVFEAGDMGTIMARAIFAVPGHYAFGVMMGYFMAMAFFCNRSKAEKRIYLILAYVAPVALHFIYDAILMTQDTGVWFSGILSIFFFWFVFKMHKRAIARIRFLQAKDGVSDR